jgi:hypothetical protein
MAASNLHRDVPSQHLLDDPDPGAGVSTGVAQGTRLQARRRTEIVLTLGSMPVDIVGCIKAALVVVMQLLGYLYLRWSGVDNEFVVP